MTIGHLIKELRLEKGLTQLQLGKAIGVSQKAIDYWEREVYEPKVSYVIALIKYFDLSYDDFFKELEI